MKTQLWILVFLMIAYAYPSQSQEQRFVVYYSDKEPPESFEPYNVVVLDSDAHPPLAPLTEDGKTVLGYISLGEVESNRSYFSHLKKSGLLLMENEHWKGSYFVDMRNPLWVKLVVEEIIPSLLAKGFHGVFLDTLDNPAHLERSNPVRYRGMTQAAVKLVKAIRLHYPDMPIMMNRGYELLPQVASSITMVLGESVYTDYDFTKKTYGHVEKATYQQQVKWLKDAQRLNPSLKIYTLDYWNKNDRPAIARIYREQRANGFIPYVSTIALNEIIHEPSAK